MKLLIVLILILSPSFASSGETIRLLQESDGETLWEWEISRKDLLAAPRWNPGEKVPLSLEECLKKAEVIEGIQVTTRIKEVALHRLPKQKDGVDKINDVFFYILTCDKSKNPVQNSTFVFLLNGKMVKPRVVALKSEAVPENRQ